MKFGGCTWIMNIMHGRLHHLRMLALMLTPFARSLLLVRVALPLYALVNSNPSLTMHSAPWHQSCELNPMATRPC
jgi:hypothetical protein